MSVGHDEYWSGEQRRHVTAARDKGVHLMFLSGNDVYWKIRCGVGGGGGYGRVAGLKKVAIC
jgi:hypothetical protein